MGIGVISNAFSGGANSGYWHDGVTKINTGNTGEGKGHTHSQNLPPYFTVYCWYRTD